MLHLFERQSGLFRGWRIEQFEETENSYRLRLTAELVDGSRLALRDFLFQDGSRSYAYQWMETDGALHRRWANAPHWPQVATAPHHTHMPDQKIPKDSTVTNIEDLLQFLTDYFEVA